MNYFHVDVFSNHPLSGNGLAVVFPEKELSDPLMQKITQEFRQFETIFVFPAIKGQIPVRIFTMEEELDFAGHPMLGAAAVIHHLQHDNRSKIDISLLAGRRRINLVSEKLNQIYRVKMNQGPAAFIRSVEPHEIKDIIAALKLSLNDLYSGYPIEVVSTGLPYLLLPVKKGALATAGIFADNFEKILNEIDAKFIYVFDPETLECRTWDNMGLVEDIATGSAAGPLCAYLVNKDYSSVDEKIMINQGKYVGRPSEITGWVSGASGEVFIEGDVVFFASGEIFNT